MKIVEYWEGHGTKILGTISAVFSTVQASLGAMTASPQFTLLVTPRQFAWLSVISGVLGVLVLRRGFENSKS